MVDQTQYEVAVKEFGNGAHIIAPKGWIGQIAQVELVGPYCPPLFNQVKEECEVFMDVEINDDEKEMESGFDEDVLSVTGEVIEFEQSVNNDSSGMSARVLIDAKTQFYRVEIQREAGDDGWNESEYIVEKDISGDEMQETDEIISMNGASMWKPIGNVNAFGVKQRV